MPKIRREILEGMSPVHGGMSYGHVSVRVPMGQESVLIAAPALALACLKADEYADIMERGEQIRMAETVRLREALRDALEAAGVEVDDGAR